jgi:hypothetical protein
MHPRLSLTRAPRRIPLKESILEPLFGHSSGISFSWKEPPSSFHFRIDRPHVVVADTE